LASPNITVQDGDRGFVLIGDRLNYPVLIGYSQANTPIFDIKTERVGIYLQVAAAIAEDGTVTMTLAPQVSTVSSYREVNGASYPQISTREAQSTIRVKSGEPIIMGGLIRDEEIRSMERVPILGDLPFLGELFRRRKTQRSSSQLVITVTPTVIKP
ncbi:MAG: type II and III secretion system protein, partial [Armatimonadota bacterium]